MFNKKMKEMKLNYLFPHKWRKIGWIVFIPSMVFGLITIITEYEPGFLDMRVPGIFIDEILGKSRVIGFTTNNILNELLGAMVIISGLLVAFSKEKNEDELISKIRLESLVWATYVNYGILLLSIIFVYGLSFFWVMVFNMFTILLFFIIRFNWQIKLLNKDSAYEE